MNVVSRPKSKKIAICNTGLPACNTTCPASEDIKSWISLAKQKKFREAWEVITTTNPFPAILGRVCYNYCETKCRRGEIDTAIGIHHIERFLGDLALTENWSFPSVSHETGKKILVVGAGPGGLSAACFLRKMGHDVTIYESMVKPGGTMLTGIPAYRLARDVLFGEIDRVVRLGVRIIYNHKVKNLIQEVDHGKFDAVFLAIGAQKGKNIDIVLENNCPIYHAVDYLRSVSDGKPYHWGDKLAVYGGGNTAIDVARTAKRLGVSEVTVIYHRTPEKMSAFPHEIEEATAEGISFIYLRSIVAVKGNSLLMNVNELDAQGRPTDVGKRETLDIDALVFALNQYPESDFLRKAPGVDLDENGLIQVDEFFMTGAKGVFAGGDAIPYDRSVTVAVDQGRRAANYINAYINDNEFGEPRPLHLKLINKDKLHAGKSPVDRSKNKLIDADIRLRSFIEVTKGHSELEITYESERCLSCGDCVGCAKCYQACPVNVISHSEASGKVIGINHERCIGCGKCVKICPCDALIMVDR
jgi:formate dehydrogenase (NADP+) beta subunit